MPSRNSNEVFSPDDSRPRSASASSAPGIDTVATRRNSSEPWHKGHYHAEAELAGNVSYIASYSRPSRPDFPDGLKVLYAGPNDIVDVCFIHGLSGNRRSTWTAHGRTRPWPKEYLPSMLPGARILTYGYDAYSSRRQDPSVDRLTEHATNLLVDLIAKRATNEATSRPLIFVCHSLGGLVCKEAILLSRSHPEFHLRGIFDSIKGIAFLGTPHKGSWMARWAKLEASACGPFISTNKSLLDILDIDSESLQSTQDRFLAMVREMRESGRSLEVTCFFEELPMPFVGKQVVSKNSATLEGYSAYGIRANHRDMIKFNSTDDNGFLKLLGELTKWKTQLTEEGTSNMTPRVATPVAKEMSDATSSFNNSGSGNQFTAPEGIQNNNAGGGH
ncbi:hypothetical protein N0V84_002837 [Fusarium piperis]|uniref:DUF676 domain-containing protein n=1 Tax=Fusarium piperis TaxID=1435070 RepID=A0A9W8WIK2_9HYPO|nr:hypothetical protein N0V84_002837 [Fusarium piperis]